MAYQFDGGYYNSFFNRYMPLRVSAPPKYLWVGDILEGDLRNKSEPQYRILEEGEPIQDGDEFRLPKISDKWESTKSVKSTFEGVAKKNILSPSQGGGTYEFRRPIRVETPGYRYLDVGEKIVEGDEYWHKGLRRWCDTRAINRVVGSTEANQYTFGADNVTDVHFKYRRQIEALKPELKPAPEDSSYRYLQAGEATKEDDEVLIRSFAGSQWEKCENGNLGSMVSKYHADQKCYRRKIDHEVLPSRPGHVYPALENEYRVRYFPPLFTTSLIEELVRENEILKDQLANAMAEVNELRGKEPQYRLLNYGEKRIEGDQLLSHGGWENSCCVGERVGNDPTLDYTGKPYEYRRKIS
jgi:hypothetical protein